MASDLMKLHAAYSIDAQINRIFVRLADCTRPTWNEHNFPEHPINNDAEETYIKQTEVKR